MAEYRTVKMSFWNDPYIEELDAEGKLLYIYLFTCPHADNLGILEVTKRKIAFETALDQKTVERIIAKLEEDGKIVSSDGVLWLTNFIKNQTSTSPKLIACLAKLLRSVSSRRIAEAIAAQYPELSEGRTTAGAKPEKPKKSAPATIVIAADTEHTVSQANDDQKNPIDTLRCDSNTLPIPSGYPTDTLGIGYPYPTDTLDIPCLEREEEREREREREEIKHRESTENEDYAPAREASQAVFENSDLPDMSVALEGSTLPLPVVVETGHEPSLEFLELREFYTREARAEGEMSGFVEYKQAKAAHDWPGIARIVTDVEARIKAGVFKTGYAPGLRRYLTERFWKAPIVPQARERPFPTGSPDEVTAKNAGNFQRALASMVPLAGDE